MSSWRGFGGVHIVGGPSVTNVRRLDSNALPWIEAAASYGIQVDPDHFERMVKELERDMERLTEEVQRQTGVYTNLDSGDQVAELLFKRLGLKQARVKMTSSGDRESVDAEVLDNIKHDHPVVPLIQEFKQCSKYKGTYCVPTLKLCRKAPDNTWRLFQNFKYTRVPSGRFAMEEPNLLAIPAHSKRAKRLREGFITRPGWKLITVDFCFHPGTQVETLLGPKAISELGIGDKVLTYRGEYIKYGEVTRSSRVRYLPAYKLTFDNGESVVASKDHKWPVKIVQDKKPWLIEEITTEHLRIGDRMVPCREGSNGPKGYKTWYSKSDRMYTKQHVLIAEAYHGTRPENHEVHHKDENHQNNDPSNLEYKPSHRHKSDHGKINYPKQDHSLRLERLREGLQHRRSYKGSLNPNSKLPTGGADRVRELAASGMKTRDIADVFGISTHYVRELVTKSKPKYREMNHRLVSKEFVGLQPMWAITVEPDHNYVLHCGVVTHNSQIEPRIAAHRSNCSGLIQIYENDEDVYSDLAITSFKLKDERYQDETGKWIYPHVDKDEHRFPAKTCILASLYDVSAGGLLAQMPIVCKRCLKESDECTCPLLGMKFDFSYWTEDLCQGLINNFYRKYPELLDMRKRDHATARRQEMVWDMWGRILHTPGVKSVLPWVVSATLRELANHPIQGGACGAFKLVMGSTHAIWEEAGLQEMVHPLLPIHDELLYECREDVAEEWIETVGGEIEHCVPLRVPVKWSGDGADNWGKIAK